MIFFFTTTQMFNCLFCALHQGQRCSLAEVRCSGIWAETASWGALVAGGSGGQKLSRLQKPVRLVDTTTSLQVWFYTKGYSPGRLSGNTYPSSACQSVSLSVTLSLSVAVQQLDFRLGGWIRTEEYNYRAQEAQPYVLLYQFNHGFSIIHSSVSCLISVFPMSDIVINIEWNIISSSTQYPLNKKIYLL